MPSRRTQLIVMLILSPQTYIFALAFLLTQMNMKLMGDMNSMKMLSRSTKGSGSTKEKTTEKPEGAEGPDSQTLSAIAASRGTTPKEPEMAAAAASYATSIEPTMILSMLLLVIGIVGAA